MGHAVVLAILVISPPYVSRGFDILRIPAMNAFILTHSIRQAFAALFPLANLFEIAALVAVLFFGAKGARLFFIYLSFAYTASAILQNISVSDEHGFAISTSTMLLTLLVARSWLQELASPKSDFTHGYSSVRAMVLAPLALLAIWQPIDPASLLPRFSLETLLSSGSSLTFCMTTIVALCVLFVFYPHVNMSALRITSAVGMLIGIGNLWLEFVHLPGLLWIGVLHIPLVALSAVGLSLSSVAAAKAAA